MGKFLVTAFTLFFFSHQAQYIGMYLLEFEKCILPDYSKWSSLGEQDEQAEV